MAYTYDDLKEMTLAQLRDVARTLESPSVQGYTQMNKEHLLPAICAVLGVDSRHHPHAHVGHGISAGLDRGTAKARLRSLKAARDQAITVHDSAQLHSIRREMHTLKHKLRHSSS
jgi:hypothetical protein